MSAQQTVHVELQDRGYDIDIGRGLLTGAAERIGKAARLSRTIVISDLNVAPLYADGLVASLIATGAQAELLTIPAGEASKSVAQAHQLWDAMLAAQVDRQTLIIAVGGGVVGDLAGFVAATFARGLRFVQVPTSLLAQVDSSVGGKVGVNLAGGKNIVGAFWQPRYVLIDVDVLPTLPDREFSAGLAEVVKYGVIADAELFKFLEENLDRIRDRHLDTLQQVVARCCQIKADVVAADERETSGRRAILNYGHTFGHAIESATAYTKYLHGEAIAIGMMCAARLATQLGKIDRALVTRQAELLEGFELPTEVTNLAGKELLELMRRDKKAQQGLVRLVLPTALGHVELIDSVSDEQILNVLSS